MVFEKRALTGPETLGQRLRQLREELPLTIEDLSRELGIAVKYVQAIEEGRYHDLPGSVYARNFVRKYVARVNVDMSAAMDRFESEYQVVSAVNPAKRPLISRPPKTGPGWWQRHLRLVLSGVVIAVVLSYFGWQVYQLFRPPELIVFEPSRDIATMERTIVVSGQSEPEVSLTINHQAVDVGPSGQFREEIDLQPGLNVLRIASKRTRSREQIVIRNVLVEQAP